MTLTASNTGTRALLRVVVTGYLRGNLSPRYTWVRVYNSSNAAKQHTEPKLKSTHLIATYATEALKVRAGVKDSEGVWSEATALLPHTPANFVTGGVSQASIGSGAETVELLEAPSVLFPDLNFGTGIVRVYRTIVGEGFYDETRRYGQEVARAAFAVRLDNLDEEQVSLLHKFFRELNGPLKSFLLDFTDPTTQQFKRYTVRFRDGAISDDLFTVDRSNLSFNLVEIIGQSAGGDVV